MLTLNKSFYVFVIIILFLSGLIYAEGTIEWDAVNVRVYVHRISDSNGEYGKPYNLIDSQMDNLKDVYDDFGIYIQWINPEDIDEIMDDAYAVPHPDFDNLFQVNRQPNAIDIYFGSTHSPTVKLGWAGDIPSLKLWVNGSVSENVLVHEMAHCFWLYHTYDDRSREYETYLPHDDWGNSSYWLNCTEYQFGNNPIEYPPTIIATNYMSASPYYCKDSFSPDQSDRMRFRLEEKSFYQNVASECITVTLKNSTLGFSDNLGGYLGLDDYATAASVYMITLISPPDQTSLW
ncbi:MAG: hypothetical protein GF313_07740 [Caldithrix sp.]|nr:hypothetical protein [Caldithrix sp.]